MEKERVQQKQSPESAESAQGAPVGSHDAYADDVLADALPSPELQPEIEDEPEGYDGNDDEPGRVIGGVRWIDIAEVAAQKELEKSDNDEHGGESEEDDRIEDECGNARLEAGASISPRSNSRIHRQTDLPATPESVTRPIIARDGG